MSTTHQTTRLLTYENHDAYLLYKAVEQYYPNVHGEITLKYALYLYYKIHPEERPVTYKGYKSKIA